LSFYGVVNYNPIDIRLSTIMLLLIEQNNEIERLGLLTKAKNN